MRNTTKLKHLLLKYTIEFSSDDAEEITLTVIDKFNGKIKSFTHKSYSSLMASAYSHMKKELKAIENENNKNS
jgi:hypothetical protein